MQKSGSRSKLILLCLVLVCLGLLWCAVVWLVFMPIKRIGTDLPVVVGLFLFFLSVVMSVVAYQKLANQAGSRGRKTFVVGGLVVLLVMFVTLSALTLKLVLQPNERHVQAACMSSMRQLGLALLYYSEDNDNHFPAAGQWTDDIKEYVRSYELFLCPKAEGDGGSSYAFNAALDKISYADVKDPSHTVLLFESDRGWNAAGGPELLAAEPRHPGGDIFVFADGHVAWVNRSEQGTLRWEP